MARKNLNMKAIEKGLARGMTYRALGDLLGVHHTTVYYAARGGRKEAKSPLGKQRSVYLSDELWGWICVQAEQAGVSRAAFLSGLVAAARTDG